MKKVTIAGVIILLISVSVIPSTAIVVIVNEFPAKLIIDGPTHGKVGETYDYTLNLTDPKGCQFFLNINWGDGTGTGWIGPFISNADVTIGHSWDKKGNYVISAVARDYNDSWYNATLEVTMPMNKPIDFNFNLLNWLFERFSNAFLMFRWF